MFRFANWLMLFAFILDLELRCQELSRQHSLSTCSASGRLAMKHTEQKHGSHPPHQHLTLNGNIRSISIADDEWKHRPVPSIWRSPQFMMRKTMPTTVIARVFIQNSCQKEICLQGSTISMICITHFGGRCLFLRLVKAIMSDPNWRGGV